VKLPTDEGVVQHRLVETWVPGCDRKKNEHDTATVGGTSNVRFRSGSTAKKPWWGLQTRCPEHRTMESLVDHETWKTEGSLGDVVLIVLCSLIACHVRFGNHNYSSPPGPGKDNILCHVSPLLLLSLFERTPNPASVCSGSCQNTQVVPPRTNLAISIPTAAYAHLGSVWKISAVPHCFRTLPSHLIFRPNVVAFHYPSTRTESFSCTTPLIDGSLRGCLNYSL